MSRPRPCDHIPCDEIYDEHVVDDEGMSSKNNLCSYLKPLSSDLKRPCERFLLNDNTKIQTDDRNELEESRVQGVDETRPKSFINYGNASNDSGFSIGDETNLKTAGGEWIIYCKNPILNTNETSVTYDDNASNSSLNTSDNETDIESILSGWVGSGDNVSESGDDTHLDSNPGSWNTSNSSVLCEDEEYEEVTSSLPTETLYKPVETYKGKNNIVRFWFFLTFSTLKLEIIDGLKY